MKMTVGSEAPLYPAETYTPQEQERIKEFRVKVGDLEGLTEEQLEDAHLIRWLRARNLDISKAYQMIKASLQWRKDNKMDGILEREDTSAYFKKMTPYANLGVTKDGYPLLLLPAGLHDNRTLIDKYGPEQLLKFNLINCEKIMKHLQELTKEQGRQVTQVVEIIDLEGYSYRQITSKLCRDMMVNMQTTFDANYPEMLRYALVINAPKVFYILFNIMKPFIPKHTLEKVDIYGPEPEKWKKVIAEKFQLDLIPPHWGGTKKGCDPFCSSDGIWAQGPVPIQFFTNPGSVTCEDDEDANLTKASINARDSLKIPLKVTKHNSSIAWRFRTQGHDIGFQIVFQDKENVLPMKRVQSQKQVQEGALPCEKLGVYTFIFDNSYSYTRSKNLHYNVAVIEPEEVNSNYESTKLVSVVSLSEEELSHKKNFVDVPGAIAAS